MSILAQLDLSDDFSIHPSKRAALEVDKAVTKGASALVYKTLQSGASTGIAAVQYENGVPLAVFGPTKVSVTDVLEKAVLYSDNQDLLYMQAKSMDHKGRYRPWVPHGIYAIPGNDKCPLNAKIISQHPKAIEVPMFVDCDSCPHYGNYANPPKDSAGNILEEQVCLPSMAICADENGELISAIGMTISKLGACLISKERDVYKNRKKSDDAEDKISLGNKQITLITRLCKTIMWDECHNLEIPKADSIEILDVTDAIPFDVTSHFHDIFATGENDFTTVKSILELFQGSITSNPVKDGTKRMLDKVAEQGHYKTLLNITVGNIGHIDVDAPNSIGIYAAYMSEVLAIATMEKGPLSRYTQEDIRLLVQIFAAIGSPRYSIQWYQEFGKEYIGIMYIDYFMANRVKKFIREMNDKYRRNFFVSATIGGFKYESLINHGKKLLRLKFGRMGDPTESCSRVKMYPDTKRINAIGQSSMRNMIGNVIADINYIAKEHGWYNCVVVCPTARQKTLIEKHPALMYKDIIVDYYRSPKTMSVKYEYVIGEIVHYPNVMILAGGSESPSHCMDVFAHSVLESKILRITEVYQAMYQATGRVKGFDKCVVYGLGVNENTMRNMVVWGYGYCPARLNGDSVVYETTVDDPIAKPEIHVEHALCDRVRDGKRFLNHLSGAEAEEWVNFVSEQEEFIEANVLEGYVGNLDTGYSSTDDNEKEIAEQQLFEAIGKIRVSKKGYEYKEADTFLYDVFCHTKSVFAVQKYSKKKGAHDFYPVREYNKRTKMFERCLPMTIADIRKHLHGVETYGAYTIADDDTVTNICFDVDSHFNKKAGMTEEEYGEVKKKAARKLSDITGFLATYKIPYILERSGSEGSYHVYIIVSPVRAEVAHWFGNAILNYLGYPGEEVFPKQPTIKNVVSGGRKGRPGNDYEFGNLIKLPLGINRKNMRKSYIMNGGCWMRYDMESGVWYEEGGYADDRPQSFRVFAINMDDVEVPGKYRARHYDSTDQNRVPWTPHGIRNIFKWALGQQLEGNEGHYFRVATMYELLFNGGYSPEEVIKAFEPQHDYKYDTTRYYVQWVLGSGHGNPYSWKKITTMFPNVVHCWKAGIDYKASEWENKK